MAASASEGAVSPDTAEEVGVTSAGDAPSRPHPRDCGPPDRFPEGRQSHLGGVPLPVISDHRPQPLDLSQTSGLGGCSVARIPAFPARKRGSLSLLYRVMSGKSIKLLGVLLEYFYCDLLG